MAGARTLVEFEPLYRAMGSLGWSPAEVDAMEVPRVGSFLGVGDFPPVARGARQIALPGDHDDAPSGAGFRDVSLARRRQARKETGRVIRGGGTPRSKAGR